MHSISCFLDPASQKLVFAEALRNGLHLSEGLAPDRSRMENLATGHRTTPDGLTVLALTEQGRLVAWAICEHPSTPFLPAIQLKDGFRHNSKIKQTYDWGYVPLGFFAVFVEPSSRGKGYAKALLLEMEAVRTSHALEQIKQHPHNLCVFQARNGSVDLVKKFCRHTGHLPYALDSPNLRSWNHFLTSDRIGAIEFGETPDESWKARVYRGSSPCRSKTP